MNGVINEGFYGFTQQRLHPKGVHPKNKSSKVNDIGDVYKLLNNLAPLIPKVILRFKNVAILVLNFQKLKFYRAQPWKLENPCWLAWKIALIRSWMRPYKNSNVKQLLRETNSRCLKNLVSLFSLVMYPGVDPERHFWGKIRKVVNLNKREKQI